MASSDFDLTACLERLATSNAGRSEADIQSDVRNILLFGGFELGEAQVRLESPAPDRQRIDIEVGFLDIECKLDLTPPRILRDAEEQLEGYLRGREGDRRGSYVGVLTDGSRWRHYQTTNEGLHLVSTLELKPGTVDERRFRTWLGSLLSTERAIQPTTTTINDRLGSDAAGCQAALTQLQNLWSSSSGLPEVRLKRALWGKLLRTALGTQFEDDDALFLEHTYLVLVATMIAHMVVGFEATELRDTPATALSGRLFSQFGIRGVGEAGFFDWVLDAPEGEGVVSEIARRLAVFSWSGVDHDVLKALYQSVVSEETRHRLGEYYTPDWLARRIVDTVVDDALNVRVLDPACGSGTFLFQAVRRYLAAAEEAGTPLRDAVSSVVEHVYGMDLHPVAVSLAAVTYLLAIGAERISEAATSLSIPVYLGDSMQWESSEDHLFSPTGEIVVPTGADGTMFSDGELRFPRSVVADPARFDRLVDELATLAADRARGTKPRPIDVILNRFGVPEVDRRVLKATYKHLCDLHDQERNHIWGFFVRNQARPTWFASEANRVDALVGNPPWLSYRYMPEVMQVRFRARSKERNLWTGRNVATQQDLSGYFVARSIELYLREGGQFGFVMPLAALSRKAYEGFRRGEYSSRASSCAVTFSTPWDLDDVDPTPFPVPASVVLGRRVKLRDYSKESALRQKRLVAKGRADEHGGPSGGEKLTWTLVSPQEGDAVYSETNSPYGERFRQGAVLVPRMLLLVEPQPPRPLQPKTHTSVRSRRGRLDKEPWRSLDDRTGVVENTFLRDVFLGEHCLPFRTLPPLTGVIPFDGKDVLSGEHPRIDRYRGFAEWWRGNERVWETNKSKASRLSLVQQVDYYGKLSAQFPVPGIRVVYTASGNSLAAAIVTDQSAVIEHKLYWGPANNMDEARYLTAVLNAPSIGELVAPYQSRGAFGARDFDKYVWYPPIPEYDPTNVVHCNLAALAARAEAIANSIDLPADAGFQRARKIIREALAAKGLFDDINTNIKKLLGIGPNA